MAFFYFKNSEHERNQLLHAKGIRDFHLAFEQYHHPLQGIVSMVHFSGLNIDPQSFRKASESRGFYKNFKGALGFGFVRKIFRKSPLEDTFVIEMMEPSETNKDLIGEVISNENSAKQAALKSMRLGIPVISKLIKLKKNNKELLVFYYFLPIYKTPRVPKEVKQREELLIGWAFVAIKAMHVVEFVKNQNPDLLSYKLFELNDQQQETLIHQEKSHQADFKYSLQIIKEKVSVAGQDWMVISASNILRDQMTFLKSLGVLLLGLISSFLFYFYSLLLKKRLDFDSQLILESQKAVEIATKELEEKKHFLQSIINGLPAIVTYWDKDLKNRLINSYAQSYMENSGEKSFGKHISELIPSEIFDLDYPFMQKALKGEAQEFERVITGNNQESRNVLIKLQPYLINDKVEGFIAILVDITDIRLLQQKDRETQALLYAESKLSLLGEMTAGIAHEINNPLAIISGKAQLAKNFVENSEMQENLKEKTLNCIGTIDLTVERIAKIIRGLKNFSRDSSYDPYTEVAVNDLMSETMMLTHDRLAKKDIQLNIEGLDTILPIFCNRVQLEQVLMNLISNAADEIEKYEERWITVKFESDVDNNYIRIIDSGKGIPDHVVSKIMNPFFSTKAVGKGTGLGLSISKKIVENHQGILKYELYQSHTSFLIILPKIIMQNSA